MSILTLGDFVTAIQNRSKAGVTYTVSPQPSGPTGGPFAIQRNGVTIYQFIWSGAGAAAWSGIGGSIDANPNGLLVEIISPDNVSSKADVQQLVNSLN